MVSLNVSVRRAGGRVIAGLFVLMGCALGPSRLSAQESEHAHHTPTAPGESCAICPAARESSGTSWQPDAAASEHHASPYGAWWVSTHAQLTVAATRERGPRGGSETFIANHAMIGARRALRGGVLGIRTMWSLEPLMGAAGYPLLLQTGETLDGVNPLIDRQHPHDLPMELALTYERALQGGAVVSFYLAAVGEPALGPPAFMHRRSADLLPTAPITHHWFDSTHISYGVATVGFAASRRMKLEGSVFRGREPDQHRWGLERPGFDSFAARLSVNPVPSLAVQVSGGVLRDAEQIHRGADVVKLTASAMYARRWPRVSVDAFAAVARNRRTAVLEAVEGGAYYAPSASAPAAIVESTAEFVGRHAVVARVEVARKGELFPLADVRHLDLFPVSRSTIGYALRLVDLPRARVQVGAALSWNRVAAEIASDYGGHQVGQIGFVRLVVH